MNKWPTWEFDTVYFMYILMFFILFYIIRENYFRGIVKKLFETIKENRKIVLIYAIFMILTVFLLDHRLAAYFSAKGNADGFFYKIVRIGNFIGNGKYLFSLIITVAMIYRLLDKEEKVNLFYLSIGAGFIARVINPFFKVIFYGQTPSEIYNSNLLISIQKAQEQGIIKKIEDTSSFFMTSGYTITATAALTVFAFHIKNRYAKILFFILPLITAMSRVYLNRQWTSDVLIEYGIGILIAGIFYDLNKYRFEN